MNSLVIQPKAESNSKQLKIENINLDFTSENSYAIIGRKGNGKSFLIAIIAGINEQSNLDLYWNETKIIDFDRYRRTISSCLLSTPQLFSTYTVEENINFLLNLNNNSKTLTDILNELNLDKEILKEDAGSLDHFTQHLVVLACVIAKQSKIIVADEPTGKMTTEEVQKYINILIPLCQKHQICLIIATESNNIANNCSVILGINNQEINYIKGQ